MPKEVDAITKLYDYILWMMPKIDAFPKSRKYTLGNRIENLLLDILQVLIQAAYSKNKTDLLGDANLKLEQMRYLTRMAKDLKPINIKTYEFSAKAIDAIGISVGGWMKYSKQ